MYELKTENFSGPLEKLLELIEAQKMDVSEVSMAKVTDDFLKYLDALRHQDTDTHGFKERMDTDVIRDDSFFIRGDLRLMADFIQVASKLIFLKSKYLLPGLELSEEEEKDIHDLENRLKIYQELKPVLKHLAKLWRESHRAYSRPYLAMNQSGLAARTHLFYPGSNLNLETLTGSLARIFDTIKTYELETETIKEKIVTLEEKISQVLDIINTRISGSSGDLQFKQLSEGASRGDMILAFLAVLHLAREQIILLEQMENFSDIMVKKNDK